MQYPVLEIQDFSGGIDERVESHLLSTNQCADAQNVICPKAGRLQKRRGQAVFNASAIGTAVLGLHPYYYGTGLTSRKLVAYFNDGGSMRISTDDFAAAIKTNLSKTAPVLSATCVNYMVSMNGVDAPWKYDGTTVSALANAPATGRCPVLYAEKLFCFSDDDTLKWSDSFLPETWTGANISTDFGKGDGDKLTALFAYSGALLVCKKRSLYRLSGTSLDNFRVTNVEGVHGVAGPRAGVVLEPYFYYISQEGIFRWDGLNARNLVKPTGKGSGLQDTWANVNKLYLEGSVASYNRFYNCLEFHVPENSDTTNTLTIVYALDTGALWKFRSKSVSCWVEYDNATTIKTYSGSMVAGSIIEQNTTAFNDLGVAISADWQGPNFCADSPIRIKRFRRAFAEDVISLNDAVFQYRLNTASSWTAPTASTDSNDARKYMIPHTRSRFFQPRFTHAVLNADFALSGFKLQYKPKKDK